MSNFQKLKAGSDALSEKFVACLVNEKSEKNYFCNKLDTWKYWSTTPLCQGTTTGLNCTTSKCKQYSPTYSPNHKRILFKTLNKGHANFFEYCVLIVNLG